MSPSRPPEAPRGSAGETPARTVACPFCGSTDVAVEAPFGGTLMTRQYWCRGCRTVFEWVKWEADPDPGSWLD